MYEHSRLTTMLGCIAALAIAGCATNGSITPVATSAIQPAAHGISFGPGWIQQDGILYHVPHYMPTRERAGAATSSGIGYHGGPVQVTPTVFLIFWGYAKYGDPNHVKPLLEKYIANIGGSDHNDIYTQYYEISHHKKVYITNPSSQYGGAWEDNSAVPMQPTDAQVAAEALKGVAHFGYDANASYLVATPHGRSTLGFGSQFCASHSATSSKRRLVSYTNLPYIPDAGENCGANVIAPPSDESGADEGVTIIEGLMQGDSATDPEPTKGWYPEIGDFCVWENIANDPFGSHSYTMQPMYSLGNRGCLQSL